MLNRFAFSLYLLALCFAPLAFGSVETWSLMLMEGLIFLATLLYLLDLGLNPSRHSPEAPGTWPLLFFVVYILIQLVPLPIEIVRILSPAGLALREQALGPEQLASTIPLTINLRHGLAEFFRFSSYACAYFLTIHLLHDRVRLKTTIKLLAALGGLIAVEALFQRATSSGLIYWFRAVPPQAMPVGPYIYRNHYAGLMGMLFPIALSIFLYTRPKTDGEIGWRQRLIVFFRDSSVSQHFLSGLAAKFIAISIFLSLSRGGISSSCAALLFMVLLLKIHPSAPSRRFWVYIVPAAAVLFINWFGWDAIVERFLQISLAEKGFHDGRFDIWHDTLTLIRDFPVTGSGLGTFVKIYPVYQGRPYSGLMVDHAHNDYLELLAGAGMIGFSLMIWFLASVIIAAWKRWRMRHSRFAIIHGAGCFAALTAMLLHCLVDFNFASGANALYFFSFCGLLTATVNCRATKDPSSSPSMFSVAPTKVLHLAICLIGILSLMVFSLQLNSGIIKAAGVYRDIRNIPIDSATPREELNRLEQTAAELIRQDITNAEYHYTAGNIALVMGQQPTAAAHYNRALQLDPTDSWAMLQLGQTEVARNSGRSQSLMQAAIAVKPYDPDVLLRFSRLQLWLGEQKAALDITGQILTAGISPPEAEALFNALLDKGIGAENIHRALKKTPEHLLIFGRYLAKNAQPEYARPVYLDLVAQSSHYPDSKPWFFTTPIWFFMGVKDFSTAREVAISGNERFPDNYELLYALGVANQRMSRFNEAEEALSRALELHPASLDGKLQLAETLSSQGKAMAAASAYDDAFKLIQESPHPRPWYFHPIKRHLLSQKRNSDAEKLMEMAVAIFPDLPNLHFQLAEVYLINDKRSRAISELRETLRLEPSNSGAAKTLEKMTNGFQKH